MNAPHLGGSIKSLATSWLQSQLLSAAVLRKWLPRALLMSAWGNGFWVGVREI